MLPCDRVYGLSGQGRAAQARVYSRTYGLAAAARDERQGRSARERKHGEEVAGQRARRRAGERTGYQLGADCNRSVAATGTGRPPALARRPPAVVGRQSVVFEREN